MSRSYRKVPWTIWVKKDSAVKKDFNRRIRRVTGVDIAEGVSDIPSGGAYRKVNETWDICDGESLGPSWPEFRDEMLCDDPDANMKVLRRKWMRWHKGK